MLLIPGSHASKNGAGKTKITDHHAEVSSKTITALKKTKQCVKEREWKPQT